MSELCVILGNGPSLKGFDFRRLEAVTSLGMNAAYRFWDEIGWYPDYYACLDDQLIISHHDEIYRLWKEGNIREFFVHGSFFDYHPDCICAPGWTSLDQVLPHWYKNRGQAQGWKDLAQYPAFRTSDTTKITTGAFATRFAAHHGHRTLGLMGIDLKYVEILPEAEKTQGVGLVMTETPKENPNYFFDSYQQKGDKYNIPNPKAHGNELHIQSFRLVAKDFASFGQNTQIFNTNPNSLLEDEKVFNLLSIDQLLIPQDLGAIVVPTTSFEIEALLANFDIWSQPNYAPLAVGDLDNRCILALMFNNDEARQYEDHIRERFSATGMQRFFSQLSITYLGLSGEDDKYERDYSKKVGDQGYKSGPNNQFFLTMKKAQDLGRYAFLMETDCVPLRPGWLSNLRETIAQEAPFWILGSRYHGEETLDPSFRNHLNGNAIYAVGEPGFQSFIKSFWEPRTRAMVSGVDKRLAYDCILEKIFTEHSDTAEVNQLLTEHGDKFRATKYILNVSGRRDLEELSKTYRADFLDQFPDAYVLHNRTAQQRTAKLIPVSARDKCPRLLVIDMTAIGSRSATGQIKSTLLSGWDPNKIMQIAAPSDTRLSLVRQTTPGEYEEHDATEAQIRCAIDAFAPELILYRPLADRPVLHKLAMAEITRRDLPLVTWLMDDWPERLRAEAPDRFDVLDTDLRHLLDRSKLCLSICDAMSDAFSQRYGVPFHAFANAVDLTDWPDQGPHDAGPVRIRYAGALASDMGASAVQRVAQAVQTLADMGTDIRFEINTQPWWLEESKHLFERLDATTLTATRRSAKDYQAWLRDADVLLIAYNFDPDSVRYVRYSMANKMPECLASGAALLVHGPQEIATVGYLADQNAAELVDKSDINSLVEALRRLTDPDHRTELARRGRELVAERHELQATRNRLETAMAWAVGASPRAEVRAYVLNGRAAPQMCDVEELTTNLPTAAAALILYDDPDMALAAALQAGQSPEAVLETWRISSEAALKAYRQAPQKVHLFEKTAFKAAELQAGISLLQDRLPDLNLPEEVFMSLSHPDPILLTIAEQYRRRSSNHETLLNELRAVTLRPQSTYSERITTLDQARTRYVLLSEQAQTASQQNTTLVDVRNTLKKQSAAHNAELERLRQEIDTCKAEIDHIYRSKSWRITGPLRGLRRLMGAQPMDLPKK